MPSAPINHIWMNYEVHGAGAPLLLIAGLSDDLSTWRLQGEAFARRYQVITFDNRGAGQTEKPRGPYSTSQMAADARGILDVLGIERAHVVGVGMGGMIAQEFAVAYPERLDRLVLACTCMAPSEANRRLYRFWQRAAPAVGVRQIKEEALLWHFTPSLFEDARKAEAVAAAFLRGGEQPLDAYLSQLQSILAHDSTASVSQIAAPTLVLGAPEDRLCTPDQVRRLQQAVPGAELAFTAHGANGCLWEYPEQLNSAVLGFIEQRA
jgi:3-oxoadipate enol-lactonase